MSETKAYPGIPAGICDEDLEEHMSEKGPFDAAIEEKSMDRLTGIDWVVSALRAVRALNDGYEAHQGWIDDALRVLTAAGRVDKDALFTLGANAVCIADYYCQGAELRDMEARFKRGKDDLKIIIDSLPDKRGNEKP